MIKERTQRLSPLNALLLFSGIIPATMLFGLSVFMLMSLSLDSFRSMISLLSIVSGIIGYFGLVSCIADQSRRSARWAAICLGLGISGFSIFIIMEGGSQFLDWVIAFEEKGEIFMLLWPLLVSIYFFILTVRMAISEE